MTQQIINIGTSPNDTTGDPLRTAFGKVNANFTELYATTSADVQIPAQGSNSGKYLTTNGTALSWGTVSQDRLVNGSFNFTLGIDGTINFDPSSANGKGILQTAADLQFIAVDKTWTFGTDGALTFPDTSVQTTAALPYVKSTFTGGTATLDIFTATWVNSVAIRLQISVSNTVNVTLQYTATSIIAGTTTSTNGGGMWTQSPSGAPFSSNNLDNLGDIQVMYLQDITNQKIYRITGMNTAGNVNPAQGSVLIERII